MTLSQERLQAALPARSVHYFSQVDSTNTLALDHARAGKAVGAIFVADEQLHGRGRLGRGWFAPPGTALMFSVVLPPLPTLLKQATLLGSVAVCEALEQLGVESVGIKWPNDVQIGGLKVCGVLPEAAWDGAQLVGLVLGIGLNVRIDFNNTPLAGKAVSVETALGRHIDRLDLLVRLLDGVDSWTAQPDTGSLWAAWRARLNMMGQSVIVTTPSGDVCGTAVDIDDDGALLLLLTNGEKYRAVAGDLAIGAQE